MPKKCVVRYRPVRPYHGGRPATEGSAANAPRGCLSIPIAMVRSCSPVWMARAAMASAVPAVAQPLNTPRSGTPVSPSRPTIASGLYTSRLPTKPAWTCGQLTPASSSADRTASAAMSIADLPGNRPNGCSPTPMMTGSMSILRGERERHDLGSVRRDAVGHDGHPHRLADSQPGRVRLGQPGLHHDLASQVHVADRVRPEGLRGVGAIVGRARRAEGPRGGR